MLLHLKMKKRKWRRILWCTVIMILGGVIYYNGLEPSEDYMHYYVLPNDVKIVDPKIIFLWTTYFNDYNHWLWGIGPSPVISDCNDINIDEKCFITTHVDLLQKADVILFSLSDMQQVS